MGPILAAIMSHLKKLQMWNRRAFTILTSIILIILIIFILLILRILLILLLIIVIIVMIISSFRHGHSKTNFFPPPVPGSNTTPYDYLHCFSCRICSLMSRLSPKCLPYKEGDRHQKRTASKRT